MGGGQRERVRPRRGLCRSCGATHILLPSWAAPRHADAIGVIARAAALSVLHGAGSARLGVETASRPARCAAGCGGCAPGPTSCCRRPLRAFGFPVAVIETPEGRDPCPAGPTGSVLGDALAALAACAYAAIRWHGYADQDLGALTGRFGLAPALAQAPGS
jgi:hypothetical protein